MNTEVGKPALYERLGGVHAIAAAIDDFIDRIMANPVLNANPRVDEAHHRVSKAGFKYLVTEMVCWATGGPQTYTGRPMRESHRDLKITEREWAAFCEDFQDTLDKFAVPAAEQQELFAIVQSTKGDIVLG
jgi:hemoglobin